MITYVDSSALVKRYVDEPGSVEVDAYLDAATEIGSAAITLVECLAAIAKSVRRGDITQADGVAAMADLEYGWRFIRQVPVTTALLHDACNLTKAHGLRGYDAVQLAAALTFQTIAAEPISLASYDRELRDAAGAEGVQVWPAVLP